MNSSIALERIDEVIRTDSVTVSEGDFMLTHVPFRNIREFASHSKNMANEAGKSITEKEIFETTVLNPNQKHQFVVIYGESGTGKSNLIRWMKNAYVQSKPENEVILFIRRKDNTLKGTIEQLLSSDAIKNLSTNEAFERMKFAARPVDEEKLRTELYFKLIAKIQNDYGEDDSDSLLSNVTRKRLIEFLKAESVEEQLKMENGPLDRIAQKIVSTKKQVTLDFEAEFSAEDFDFIDNAQFSDEFNAAVTSKALRFRNSYQAEEDLPEKLIKYLNRFVEPVVREAVGLHEDDFREIFLQIRRELKKKNKNLTLFIEDITSFTGINLDLLNSLIEEHTGEASGDLCRLSSFVGTTTYYLDEVFRSNFWDRVTKYFYIPKNIFTDEDLYQFFARYLNAISLDESTVDQWMKERNYYETQIPIHQETQGANWDHISLGVNESVALYPFSKKSIKHIYDILDPEERTPRYLLKQVLHPLTKQILEQPEIFPTLERKLDQRLISSLDLKKAIDKLQLPETEQKRLETFLLVWGNGKDEIEKRGGETFTSSINNKILVELDFEIPQFNVIESVIKPASIKDRSHSELILGKNIPAQVIEPGELEAKKNKSEPKAISDDSTVKSTPNKNEVKKSAHPMEIALLRWLNGETLALRTTGGISGSINQSLRALTKYYLNTVHWRQEGFSIYAQNQIMQNDNIFSLPNTSRKTSKNLSILLDQSVETVEVLLKMFQFSDQGKNTWAYPEGLKDLIDIQKWLTKYKLIFLDQLKKQIGPRFEEEQLRLIKAEMIRQIFVSESADQFKQNNVMGFLEQSVQAKSSQSNPTLHSLAWTEYFDQMSLNPEVLSMFSVQTSVKSGVSIIDYAAAEAIYKKASNSLKRIQYNPQEFCQGKNELESNLMAVAHAEWNAHYDTAQQILSSLSLKEVSNPDLFIEEYQFLKDEIQQSDYRTRNLPYLDKSELSRLKKRLHNFEKEYNKLLNEPRTERSAVDDLIKFTKYNLSELKGLSSQINTIEILLSKINAEISIKGETVTDNSGLETDDNVQKEVHSFERSIEALNEILDQVRVEGS